MTTNTLTNTTGQTGIRLNLRLLGTLGMLGSPMILLEGLYAGFSQHGTDAVIGGLEVIYMGGWMASVLGLHALNATGRGRWGKTALVIQFLGLLVAAGWSAYHIFTPNPATDHILYVLTDIAWPFSHLFMLVVAITIARAGVWTGWRRLGPFIAGLALPVAMLSAGLVGEVALGMVFGLMTTLGLGLQGYAVRSGREE